MRLVVGAPVAERAWALPYWSECLGRQTLKPDALVFVYSHSNDDTWDELERSAERAGAREVIRVTDPSVPHQRHDNERFHTLARLRNELLGLARVVAGADVFVSLDTDVMLEDPDTLKRLMQLLDAGWATASPALFLSPQPVTPNWAFNAGWWQDHDDEPSPQRAWVRPPPDTIDWADLHRIDIPMAAIAMNANVLRDCRYRHHESGEDIGFAHDLERTGAGCVWDTSLRARHVWSPEHL